MAIHQRVSGIYAYGQSLVDKIITPQTREKYYAYISDFAKDQPLLFTFLLVQLLFSFTPLAIFTSFLLGTFLLSLVTALLFSLFWTGVALLVLVPTLFVTVSLGVLVWIWGVSCFVAARWVLGVVQGVRGAGPVVVVNGKKGKSFVKREDEARVKEVDGEEA